ncbi:MAG TPA: grasp-with-spasm system ATP-grasp peptide maturase [Allosphingosinicella sp.]
MILIFSTALDPATNDVMPWLARGRSKIVRVNDDDSPAEPIELELSETDVRFRLDGRWYSSGDLEAVWYRKGTFWFPAADSPLHFPGQEALQAKLEARLKSETSVARQYFHHFLQAAGTRVLGTPSGDPNKLVVLHKAREVGLKVPPFQVLNRLGQSQLADPSRYITKAMSDGLYLWDFDGAQRGYFSYTEELQTALPERNGADGFPLSFVQEKIRKRFETRTFYLDGRMFSAAIYSQNDPQTSVDYRKYNYRRPNRNVPIDLPADVAEKLDRLFRALELNTGSVDMIVDEDGEFVFLEINPTGQYSYVSKICNFNIDQLIAEWLVAETIDG